MKITKCEGNRQGICNRCGNIVWMTLLYKIENVQGIYCSNCVRKMGYCNGILAYVDSDSDRDFIEDK